MMLHSWTQSNPYPISVYWHRWCGR